MRVHDARRQSQHAAASWHIVVREPVVGLVHACRAPPETQAPAVTHTVRRVRPRAPTHTTRRDGCDSPRVDVAAPRHARSADDVLPAHATRSRATSTMMVLVFAIALRSTHLGWQSQAAPPRVSLGEHVAPVHRVRPTAGPPSASQAEVLARRSMISGERRERRRMIQAFARPRDTHPRRGARNQGSRYRVQDPLAAGSTGSSRSRALGKLL